MKKTEILSTISLGVGSFAAYGFYKIWPNAHWAVYPIVALAVAGFFYEYVIKQAANEALVDGHINRREKAKSNKSFRDQHGRPATIEELLLHIPAEKNADPASSAQRTAVERIGLGPVPDAISSEQAGALLSARSYAQAVADKATTDYHLGKEVTKSLVGFIVTDRPLLARVLAWNERSFARGRGDAVSPKKDEYWRRTLAEAKRLARSLG